MAMTSGAPSTAPRRRSALEAIHAALAGGAAAAGQGWPMSYGDTQGERHAVQTTIGLAEPGLYDKLVVRGRARGSPCGRWAWRASRVR